MYKLKIQLYFFRWASLGLVILYQTMVCIIAIFLGHKSNKWVLVPSNRLYNIIMYRMKLLQLPVKGIRFYPISLNCIRNVNPVTPGIVRAFSTAPDSEFSTEEISKAKEWMENFSSTQVPDNIFEISYSRASGAGGQKVNKTSSKATIALGPDQWLNPQFCFWIPKPIRAQINENKIRYETKSGGILVQSDSTRNRDINTDECFRKLIQEIKDNTFFAGETSEEDKKRWQEIKDDRKEKRLFNKKRQSDKKKHRSKNFDV